MSKRNSVVGALLCTLSIITGNALATSAHADIPWFTIELSDLNISDGITPAITFPYDPWVQVMVGVYNRTTYYEDYSGGYGTLHAATGTGIAITTVLPGSGSSNVQTFIADALAYSSGSQVMPFVLTPNTRVLFGVGFAAGQDRQPGDTVYAYASLEADMTGGQRFSGRLRTESDALHGETTSLYYGELLSDAGGGEGTFRLETVASALTAVAPVPEPGSWAMLTAGLAVLGGGQWRRWRRRGESAKN